MKDRDAAKIKVFLVDDYAICATPHGWTSLR